MAGIVITGGLGHLGSALIRAWLDRGESLTIVDNLSTGKHFSLCGLKGDWKLIEADVRKVDAAVFKDQVVVHLAAIAEPQTSLDDPERVMAHNMECTTYIVSCKPSHLVFASSAGVYGPRNGNAIFNPQTPYSVAKLKEESIARNVPRTTIFRFGTLFGYSPGMRFHTAVNKFCWQAATHQPLTVWESAYDKKRPYLDVIDAAETIIGCYDQPGIYDVASCHATVRDVIETIRPFAPWLEVNIVPSPPMNQDSYEVECLLPVRGSLERGIAHTMACLL